MSVKLNGKLNSKVLFWIRLSVQVEIVESANNWECMHMTMEYMFKVNISISIYV